MVKVYEFPSGKVVHDSAQDGRAMLEAGFGDGGPSTLAEAEALAKRVVEAAVEAALPKTEPVKRAKKARAMVDQRDRESCEEYVKEHERWLKTSGGWPSSVDVQDRMRAWLRKEWVDWAELEKRSGAADLPPAVSMDETLRRIAEGDARCPDGRHPGCHCPDGDGALHQPGCPDFDVVGD